MSKATIGFALCGSFCTFSRALAAMRALSEANYSILPIFSQNAASIDTRFGKAEDFVKEAEEIAGRKAILTIEQAEPIGPHKMTDLLLVAPCTGNTLAKLSNGITDTPVTMAVKSHLRGARPVLVAVSTNDALAASAQNLGRLLNTKHYFLFHLHRMRPLQSRIRSLQISAIIPQAVEEALLHRQLEPVILPPRIHQDTN